MVVGGRYPFSDLCESRLGAHAVGITMDEQQVHAAMVLQSMTYLVFHTAAAIPRDPISFRRAAIDEQCLNVMNQGGVG